MLTALVFSAAAAAQPPEALRARVQACGACHGADGNSQTTGVPSLAGQPRIFLENQLVLIREGLSGNEVMESLLRGLSDREIVAIATHFAQLSARPAPGALDQALFRRGRQAAAKLRCGTCHLPDFRGREQMPRLSGQREEYLRETMRAYRDKPRRGGDTIMSAALYGVSDADIAAMAHFLARLR